MITAHSIDLTRIHEPCFGLRNGTCVVRAKRDKNCGTYKCPFYKPMSCKKWVRVEDRMGINLIPPEEAGL